MRHAHAVKEQATLSALDKSLINMLQNGLPVCESPFAEIAKQVGSTEEQVIEHLNNLLEDKTLSRFGPMFDAACLGGAFTLAAMQVPEENFEQVSEAVNEFEQVAHNYKRAHLLNMWFVVATESEEEIDQVIQAIEKKANIEVFNFPKLEEFYVGLYLPV